MGRAFFGCARTRAKAAKPEQFIDPTILREIEKSGFVTRLYQK
jgi:hypothetical protein